MNTLRGEIPLYSRMPANVERMTELENHHLATTITVKTDSGNFNHELKLDEKQYYTALKYLSVSYLSLMIKLQEICGKVGIWPQILKSW